MLNHHFSIATVLAVTIVVSAVGDEKQNKLSIVDDGKALTVRAGDDVVLKYNIATVPSPIEDKPYYARSGHIHPVYSPQGHIVTGDMCPDHRHQHAIWFAWTNTRFQGRKIDFWNSQAQQGRIEHAEVLKKQSNDGEARFQVRLRHLDITGEEPKEVLHETWNVRVRAVDDVYVIDLQSTQRCATDSPLLIKKYHYGAMGLRAPMAWNAPHGDFLTSEGKTRADGNHTRPKWVDSYGPVESEGENPQIAGITVMQHPLNFRYPQPARLHPKFSYFCFAPMVLGDFEITPGEPYVSRFRYVVHDGPLDKDTTERLWKEFSETRAAGVNNDAETFVIHLAADGSLSLDGQSVSKAQLAGRVQDRTAGSHNADAAKALPTVEIVAAEDVPFKHVVQLITSLSAANIKNVKFRSPQKD